MSAQVATGLEATFIDAHEPSGARADTVVAGSAPEQGSPRDAQVDGLRTHQTTTLPRVDRNGDKLVMKPSGDAERYLNIKPLGRGAAGDVYLVDDNDIRRRVAVKRLNTKARPMVARFVEEIRTVGMLEHPNIVPIHDVGVDEHGHLFFVMKYVEGETLESLIQRLRDGDPDAHAAYPFHRRAGVFAEILRAIAFAHRSGYVHRDIKPANIMVGPRGEVTVMDWGLAKDVTTESWLTGVRVDSVPDPNIGFGETLMGDIATQDNEASEVLTTASTQHGSLLGTPMYMAPEQAEGDHDRVDQLSDIYALGVVFHEFMSLTHYLHDKTSLNAMLFGVMNTEPEFASMIDTTHQSRVPGEYGHFVKHALRKDRSQRYQSVDVMLASLELAMSGNFDAECPVTFVKKYTHSYIRALDNHPLLFAIVLPVLAVGGFVTSIVLALT